MRMIHSSPTDVVGEFQTAKMIIDEADVLLKTAPSNSSWLFMDYNKPLAYRHQTRHLTAQLTSGEPTQLVPKEQPPRKLSGNRTDANTKTLESGTSFVPAEGIAISGTRTEGASRAKAMPSRPSGAV